MLRTRENSDVFNSLDEIYLVFTSKKQISSISYSDHNLEEVIYKLIKDSLLLIKWFLNNKMKANPEKFQAIAIGKQTRKENITFNLKNNEIKCEHSVKLLGVTLDFD